MDNPGGIKKDWKYYLGLALLIYSVIPYVVSGVIVFLKIPLAKLLSLMGVLVISAEIAFAASVVLLGKPFLEMMKAWMKMFSARGAATVAPQPVSKARHAVGVWLLLTSFLPYLFVEVSLLCGYPKDDGHLAMFFVLLSSDLLFMISLVVLGADFWQRLKKLFEWPGAA